MSDWEFHFVFYGDAEKYSFNILVRVGIRFRDLCGARYDVEQSTTAVGKNDLLPSNKNLNMAKYVKIGNHTKWHLLL